MLLAAPGAAAGMRGEAPPERRADAAVARGRPSLPMWFAIASLTGLLLLVAVSRLAFGSIEALDAAILVAVRHAAESGSAGWTAWRWTMLAATALGALPTLAVILLGAGAVLVRLGRRPAALRLLGEAGAGMLAANLVKHLVARPRPALVAHWTVANGASFPSGHSADSAIVLLLLAGMLADHLERFPTARRVQMLAVALVLLVGISRVYLGVHWPTDVLAGWAFGGGWVWFCRAVDAPAGAATAFNDVVVYPTQGLLKPPFLLFRGGPDWPSFWFRVHARHARFPLPVPLDVRPHRRGSVVTDEEPAGIWCGPVSQHFGHAIASFGSRLPASSRLAPGIPLVFSAQPAEAPPPFFWQILAHYGVAPDRVRIVSTPTRFGRLLVVPQAERLSGGGPSRAHLDLMDRLAGAAPEPDGSLVYVSRAGMWRGRIAGEPYLEQQLERAGYRVLRPESVCLDEQLALYRRASHLLFAEGSALHALQLLGRIGADVTVIVRRTGGRLARAAVRPRAASLTYIDAVKGILHGLRGDGRPQPSAGLTIVDDGALVGALEGTGARIGAHWDQAAFWRHQAHDLKVWIDARLAHPLHSGEEAAIRRSLARLGMDRP